MTLTLLNLEELWRFLFLTVRLSALMFALPFFSSRAIPAPLKVVCIVTLSVSFYPIVQRQPVPIPFGPVHLGLLICGELLVGLLIGFVAQVLFASIQLGGELINQQMGLSLASILDPQNGQQSSIISNFQHILAFLMFFTMHAHHWVIQAMAESLHAIPLLGSTLPTTMFSATFQQGFRDGHTDRCPYHGSFAACQCWDGDRGAAGATDERVHFKLSGNHWGGAHHVGRNAPLLYRELADTVWTAQ
jgi:flagellar biosynthesis protein FliR